MYKKVRELSKKKSSAAPTLLDIHGLPITDSEARRERWKDHFSEKLKRKSGIVAPQFLGFFKRALELLISFQMTPLIDLSGLLTLEHATYNCPWEKQSVFRSIPHYSNDVSLCPGRHLYSLCPGVPVVICVPVSQFVISL